MSEIKYRYSSLEDYLISKPLTVDGELDDGWDAKFPVKGREVAATILFADISGFSSRSRDLTGTETLVFVNNFFAWITAEALRSGNGIVDKYIGDEIMVVFSEEFGSKNPFLDAIRTARRMAENDALSFLPHFGLASGNVTIGFVGTPIKYNCSVFGAPVAIAARCAAVKVVPTGQTISGPIIFPAEEWGELDFETAFPPITYVYPDGKEETRPHSWKLLPPREVEMKNLGSRMIREIIKQSMFFPPTSATDRAKLNLENLLDNGQYRPNLTK